MVLAASPQPSFDLILCYTDMSLLLCSAINVTLTRRSLTGASKIRSLVRFNLLFTQEGKRSVQNGQQLEGALHNRLAHKDEGREREKHRKGGKGEEWDQKSGKNRSETTKKEFSVLVFHFAG